MGNITTLRLSFIVEGDSDFQLRSHFEFASVFVKRS